MDIGLFFGSFSFYIGFRSYQLSRQFILVIRQTALKMTTWQQVQRQRLSGKAVTNSTDFSQHALCLEDQLFLFLCKMRLGSFNQELADRFNTSASTLSRYIITRANYLYFFLGAIPIWPSRKKIDQLMPTFFKEQYPATRLILDCSEIRSQSLSSLVLQTE